MNEMNAQEQSSAEKWEQPVDIPVGEILRRARVHYSLSLPDVEQALRIRASQLDALEMMDMTRLPGRVYAIGFVRTYSEFLGLDGGRMVHLFKTQVMDGGPKRATMNYSVAASESKVPNLYILGGSFAALVVIVGCAFFMTSGGSGGKTAEDIPPVTATNSYDEQQIMMSFSEPQPLQAAMMAAISPAAGLEKTAVVQESEVVAVETLVVTVDDTAWVEIRDGDGKTVVSRVFQIGDSYPIPTDATGWELSTGNAGGLVFTVNGEVLPKLGVKGDVLRHIDLDPEALLDKVSFAALNAENAATPE